MKARENPFRTSRMEKLSFRLRGTSWEAVLDRLESNKLRGEIVGLKGSGKTLFLEELSRCLLERGYKTKLCRVPDRLGGIFVLWELLQAIISGQIVLLDSAGLLNTVSWFFIVALANFAPGLVVSRHTKGYFPLLYHCLTSPELLEELVLELTVENGAPMLPPISSLYSESRGNIRTALLDCYDEMSRE